MGKESVLCGFLRKYCVWVWNGGSRASSHAEGGHVRFSRGASSPSFSVRYQGESWGISAQETCLAAQPSFEIGNANSRIMIRNPFFSKQKVAALQPVIQRLAEKLCAKFEKCKGTEEIVPLECAFDAFTMDVITEYSLDTSFGYLDHPGWSSDFRELERAFGEMGYMQKMFPPMIKMMQSLPDKVVIWMDPKSKLLLDFFRECYTIAERMLKDTDGEKYEEKEHPTIFYEIIHSDLPPAEKLPKRLEGEAAAVLGAGAVTTAWTLTVGMYHLTVQQEKLERLRAEVRSVMPDPYQPVKLQQLEQLPYLTAVIMESLRLSNGVSTRLARVAPDRSIYFRDWEIPKGTPVGMTSTLIHQNPDIFPQPFEFIPERWLDPKERQRLESYLVPFSKGTRQCAGIK